MVFKISLAATLVLLVPGNRTCKSFEPWVSLEIVSKKQYFCKNLFQFCCCWSLCDDWIQLDKKYTIDHHFTCYNYITWTAMCSNGFSSQCFPYNKINNTCIRKCSNWCHLVTKLHITLKNDLILIHMLNHCCLVSPYFGLTYSILILCFLATIYMLPA